MNTPATFKQSDLRRAIRAARKESPDLRVRVTKTGDIIIEPAQGPDPTPQAGLDASAEIVM